MAAKSQAQTNKDQSDSNGLVAYRLAAVENAVKDLTSRFDGQNNIQKPDLKELVDNVKDLISNVKNDLQKQIDKKADSEDVKNLTWLVRGIVTAILGIIISVVSYYFTHNHA